MRGGPIDLPALRYPRQGIGALAGRLLRAVLLIAVGAVLLAVRVLLALLLRVLRPFITWPLLLGCLWGVAAALGFAVSHMWADAARAGFVALTCALILGLYSMLVQAIAPEPFDQVPLRHRRL